jgi:hypothetical protein
VTTTGAPIFDAEPGLGEQGDDFGLGDAIAAQREARRKIDLSRAGTHFDPAAY